MSLCLISPFCCGGLFRYKKGLWEAVLVWILACRDGTTGRYSTGETPPIKAEWPELSDHLGSACLRGNTSTRIWARALQPDQEEVSSWRFCRAQIVSGHQTFASIFWLDAGILARRGDFNACQSPIVRLYFYQAPIFCVPAYILRTRLNFHETPEF